MKLNRILSCFYKNNSGFFLLLFILIIALYGRSILFDFSGLDDWELIRNVWQKRLNSFSVIDSFRSGLFGLQAETDFYRPILRMYFDALIFISGAEASAKMFHLSSLVLWCLNLVLVFKLLSKYLRVSESKVVLLFFALHPLSAVLVAWIPASNELLLFPLLYVQFYLWERFQNKRNILYGALLSFAFFVSLFVKESAALMLLLLPLHAFFYSFQSDFSEFKPFLKSSSFLSLIILQFFLFILFLYLRSAYLENSDISYFSYKHIVAFPVVAMQHFSFLVFPFPLSVVAEFNWLWAIPGLSFILIMFMWHRFLGLKLNLFPLLWFMIWMLPNVLSDYILYHRLFIAGIFMPIYVVSVYNAFIKGYFQKFLRFKIPLYLVLLGLVSLFYLSAFKNETHFWKNYQKNYPSSYKANYGLAFVYQSNTAFSEALPFYQKAAVINPNKTFLHSNLASCFHALGEPVKRDSVLEIEKAVNADSSVYVYYTLYFALEDGDFLKASSILNTNILLYNFGVYSHQIDSISKEIANRN